MSSPIASRIAAARSPSRRTPRGRGRRRAPVAPCGRLARPHARRRPADRPVRPRARQRREVDAEVGGHAARERRDARPRRPPRAPSAGAGGLEPRAARCARAAAGAAPGAARLRRLAAASVRRRRVARPPSGVPDRHRVSDGTRSSSTTPSSKISTSISALSVSTTATMSPRCTASPGLDPPLERASPRPCRRRARASGTQPSARPPSRAPRRRSSSAWGSAASSRCLRVGHRHLGAADALDRRVEVVERAPR